MTTARMLLPLGLIALAAAFAALLAYGTHPHLIEFPGGLSIIMFARRLEWLMVALSLVASLTLIVAVISGRRRAWWLIGLAPVLALFAHRFATGDVARHAIADEPQFVAADEARLGDDDYVVALNFADQTYAYPYSALYWTPLVVQTDRDQRLLVSWCAFADSALATTVSRDIKGRELDIVCEPANALLIYNSRIGQFINGLTGRTPGGAKPIGFGERIAVWKGPWKTWREAHPGTRVMVSQGKPGGPGAPILPREPFVASTDMKADTPVVLLATTRPIALVASEISNQPSNVRAAQTPLLVFRDARTGDVRAFDRRVEADLIPRFVLNQDPKRKGIFRDLDTNTCWSAGGVAVDGEKERLGHKLTPVAVQDQTYWGVAKYWWPNVELVKGEAEVAGGNTGSGGAATRPAHQQAHAARSRRRR